MYSSSTTGSQRKSRWSTDSRQETRAFETEVEDQATRVPTHDEIQLRAFNIYVQNGCQEGKSEQYWLEAERELLEEYRDGASVTSSVTGSAGPL